MPIAPRMKRRVEVDDVPVQLVVQVYIDHVHHKSQSKNAP